MYNQGYRPQPGQTKSGYYDAQGNWYVPVPGQAQPLKGALGIERDDGGRRLAGEQPQQHGDQAAHDMGVGIAPEDHASAGLGFGDQPDLAGAAAHLVGLVALGVA